MASKKPDEKKKTGPATKVDFRQLAQNFNVENSCPRCNKSVYYTDGVVAGGRHYHKTGGCYTCKLCGKNLDSKLLAVTKDEIYCKACHQKNFGPRGVACGYNKGAAISAAPAPVNKAEAKAEAPVVEETAPEPAPAAAVVRTAPKKMNIPSAFTKPNPVVEQPVKRVPPKKAPEPQPEQQPEPEQQHESSAAPVAAAAAVAVAAAGAGYMASESAPEVPAEGEPAPVEQEQHAVEAPVEELQQASLQEQPQEQQEQPQEQPQEYQEQPQEPVYDQQPQEDQQAPEVPPE